MSTKRELSDDELLRKAGEACARQETERLFPADEAWRQFERRHKRKKRYGAWAAVAAVLVLALLYGGYRAAQEPKPVPLFTAATGEQQIWLESATGEREAVTDSLLCLNAPGYRDGTAYRIETPVGKGLRVVLPDSSIVAMNAQSRLTYAAERGQRRVTLSGEAYFEVRRDEAHPFVVETNGVRAQVLGTAFNIRSYAKEQMHITLLSGSLALESEQHKRQIMHPGEDVSFLRDGLLLIRQTEREKPLWTAGYIAFDDVPLYDLMCELGRWYNINVVAQDAEVTRRRIHFKCRRDQSLDRLLEILNALGGFHITRKENTLFIQ